MRRLVFLPILALLCAGCYPTHIISSPGATGTVIDRDTRQPVTGARVAVSRMYQREWPEYGVPTAQEASEQIRPPQMVTGPSGRFVIPPEKKWFFQYPPPDEHARGTLVVRKEGYKSAAYPLMEGVDDNLGSVVLTPGMDKP